MKDQKDYIMDLLPDYLDNLLEPSVRKEVEDYLEKNGDCSQALDQFRELFRVMKNEASVAPPASLREKFLEQLEEEKVISRTIALDDTNTARENIWIRQTLRIAASIALLVGSFLIGKFQSEAQTSNTIAALTAEKLEMRQMAVLSLMENKSASKRIKGVTYVHGTDSPDETVIKALTDRMLYDENTNVRLTAVEALANFTASETVKEAFVKALGMEKNPGIQITLIQTLVQIQEKKAVKPLQELLKRQETQPFVKKQIESLLPSII
ncbi:MAG: HEAT repeat domain-containing protein [Bacteroidota bacterium]